MGEPPVLSTPAGAGPRIRPPAGCRYARTILPEGSGAHHPMAAAGRDPGRVPVRPRPRPRRTGTGQGGVVGAVAPPSSRATRGGGAHEPPDVRLHVVAGDHPERV